MTPAHQIRARGRTWPQRAILVVGCLIVTACLGSAAAAGYLGLRFGQIDRVEDIEVAAREVGEPANFLLVGTDTREGIDPNDPDSAGFLGDEACNCTDMIMVLRVDPERNQAYILSFPRDLYVPIAGIGTKSRINTAHAKGRQVLIDTIQDNFEIPINHYVEIDFAGFKSLVDAVGGVPLWFDTPVRDRKSGLDIPVAECQVLDGTQARQFVRSRALQYQDEDGDWRSDPTADLGRITRQQVFIRRAVAKAVGQGLTNPVTLNDLVSAGVAHLAFDELLDAGDLLSLGRAFADFDSDELIGYTIPSEPFITSGGAEVELPLMRLAQNDLNVFRGLPPGTVSPESLDVTVLNGTGIEGQAADVAGALEAVGFIIADVDSFETQDVARTTVYFSGFGEQGARRVAAHITGGADLAVLPDLGPTEILLVTGASFTTVHDQPTPPDSAEAALTTVITEATTTTVAGETPDTTTTTTVPTTTTTVVGYSTGEPPDGVECG